MEKVIDQDEILTAVRKRMAGYSEHGITEAEFDSFSELLRAVVATDTEKHQAFPDYVSESGFIEHFHVTSGGLKKSGKGYVVTESESRMLSNHKEFINSCAQMNKEKAKADSISVVEQHTSYSRKDDRLENFHESFRKAWDNHIEKLHKYTGKKHLSCFLVSSDDVFVIYEEPADEQQVLFGDIARGQIGFCLAYDPELLDYMYGFKDVIDYVVYFSVQRNYTEVIKLTNIPNLKEYLPKHKYVIYPLQVTEVMSTYSSVQKN